MELFNTLYSGLLAIWPEGWVSLYDLAHYVVLGFVVWMFLRIPPHLHNGSPRD